MSIGPASDGRLLVVVRIAVDALVYALALMALIAVASLTVGITTGGGLVRAKVVLFVAGWLVLGYAIVSLWPTNPDDADSGRTGQSIPARHDTTRFQSWVQGLPPLRWMALPPPERRLTTAGKLFLGGILVLLLSFLMETVFGVA